MNANQTFEDWWNGDDGKLYQTSVLRAARALASSAYWAGRECGVERMANAASEIFEDNKDKRELLNVGGVK